ncbi:MAG: rhomboid family intramembrane serine protease [Thermodesulfobacteriota bacterium]
MLSVRTGMTREDADTCGVVLAAAGIGHRLVLRRDGWALLVREPDADRAVRELDLYQQENPPEAQEAPPPPSAPLRSWGGIASAAAIAAFCLALGPTDETPGLATARGALAQAICAGHLSRTVTALFLHVDFLHLLGNMAGLLVFGTALCAAAGSGAGILLMLLSGAGGNLMNALFYRAGHLSVGASTGVFGAVGLLMGFTLMHKRRVAEAWLAPAAGVLFIALLGNSERADLTAHAFGCLCGLLLGLIWARIFPRPAGSRIQAVLLLSAAALTAASFAF